MKHVRNTLILFAILAFMIVAPAQQQVAHSQSCSEATAILEGPAAIPFFATPNEIGDPPYGVFEVCDDGTFLLELAPFFLEGVPGLEVQCFSDANQWSEIGVTSSIAGVGNQLVVSVEGYDICGIFNQDSLLDGDISAGTPPAISAAVGVEFQNFLFETETIENLFSLEAPMVAEILFLNYQPVAPTSGMQPTIQVYSTTDFEAGSTYANEYARLESLLVARPVLEGLSPLPHLPEQDLPQLVCGAPVYISSPDHAGIRYLTAYGFGDDSIRSTDVYYTYQGLSANGTYYISVMFPLLIEDLPPLPLFAFTDQVFAGYYERIQRELTAAEIEQISPSIATLDRIVKSIEIE